ncbi:hypothetical protein KSS87_023688 [Heliosperma pusillum]|nr:hypothetical protein KSS87_023688 [Heliosperma pusillum]
MFPRFIYPPLFSLYTPPWKHLHLCHCLCLFFPGDEVVASRLGVAMANAIPCHSNRYMAKGWKLVQMTW